MINKEYWDNFYKKHNVTNSETSFAQYALSYIKENKISGQLLDVACGNGRDSTYFQMNNIKTTGLDLSINLDNVNFKFINGNLLDFNYSDYNIIYLRFIVHSLKEEELDVLIEKMKKLNNTYIFIETRSTRDITNEQKSETNFKSSIGDKHFRMLYSKKYLDEKFSFFNILESSEDKYSKFGSDNPYCIRYILKTA